MPLLVMKFGGTSVGDVDKIRNVAQKVQREVNNGYKVIVVLSAMSGKTNELVGWVRDAAGGPDASTPGFYDAREYDTIVSSGEQITSGLLSIILQEMGTQARSWQGWQVPVKTTSAHGAARIEEIPTDNLTAKFDEGMEVAVIAGFRALAKKTVSPRSGAVVRIQLRWLSQRHLVRSGVIFIRMWTGFTRPTRVSRKKRVS